MEESSYSLFVLKGSNESSLDLTSNIIAPNYKVSDVDKYEEWEDSNYTKHRHWTCSRLEGTFTLKFFTVEDFKAFNSFVNANKKEDLSISAEVYCNNKDMIKVTDVFMDYDEEDVLPFIGKKDYEGFEVTIEERGDLT